MNIRRSSTEKLAEKGLLSDVAKTSRDYEVRQTAYRKLGLEESLEALKDIVANDGNGDARKNACGKILSQQISVLPMVGQEDVEKLRNQSQERGQQYAFYEEKPIETVEAAVLRLRKAYERDLEDIVNNSGLSMDEIPHFCVHASIYDVASDSCTHVDISIVRTTEQKYILFWMSLIELYR